MNDRRLSTFSGVALIFFAVFVDLLQFGISLIPFLGWVLAGVGGVIASFIFGIWCSHLGISLMGSKRVLGFLGTVAGESIPLVDSMFWWTMFMSYTVITEWRRARQ